MMMEDLFAVEGLSLIALETACRQVGMAKPYVPDISDLMPVLRRHLRAWEERQWAIFSLADESRRLMESIERMEIELKAAAKARAEQEQQAAKLRAVDQARQDLDDAQQMLSEAFTELTERQEAVVEAKVWVVACQDKVLKSEQALAEAVARNNNGGR